MQLRDFEEQIFSTDRAIHRAFSKQASNQAASGAEGFEGATSDGTIR
jgi:hypothetical protein